MDHGSYTFTCINTISVTFWVKIYGHELYPFHLVSDFGTEFILEPKMAFVNKIITKQEAMENFVFPYEIKTKMMNIDKK